MPAISTLLDNALGPQGYYGAFTMNMHTDLVGIGRFGRHRRGCAVSKRSDCFFAADVDLA